MGEREIFDVQAVQADCILGIQEGSPKIQSAKCSIFQSFANSGPEGFQPNASAVRQVLGKVIQGESINGAKIAMSISANIEI